MPPPLLPPCRDDGRPAIQQRSGKKRQLATYAYSRQGGQGGSNGAEHDFIPFGPRMTVEEAAAQPGQDWLPGWVAAWVKGDTKAMRRAKTGMCVPPSRAARLHPRTRAARRGQQAHA